MYFNAARSISHEIESHKGLQEVHVLANKPYIFVTLPVIGSTVLKDGNALMCLCPEILCLMIKLSVAYPAAFDLCVAHSKLIFFFQPRNACM